MPPMVVAGEIIWSAVAINVAIMVAVSVGMRVLSSLLRPKTPSFATDSQQRTLMIKQPIAPWRIQYGRDMTSGVLTFVEESDAKKYTHLILTTHGHEITEFMQIQIEDKIVALDGSGNVTLPTQYQGKAHFEFNLGTRAQTAFPGLMAALPAKWTASDKQTNRAGVYVRLETSDLTAFPNGIPNIKFLSKGKPVFDPRTNTYAYSENPALCLADYMQSRSYGLGCRGGQATRIQTSGGAATSKYALDLIVPSANGQAYETRVLVQNLGAKTVRVSDNLGGSADVAPGVTADVAFTGTGDGATTFQIKFGALLAGDALDFAVADPISRRAGEEENYVPRTKRDFSGWAAVSAATVTLTQDWSIFTEIDLDDLIAAANVCDEVVAIPGGTEPRYDCNGSFESSKKVPETMQALMSSMAGEATYVGGKWHLYAGAWRSPTLTLTDGDLRGNLRLATLVTKRELCNTVKAQFICAENKWQAGDVPTIRNDNYIVQDGEEIVRQIELPFTKRVYCAQRLMKIQMEESRAQESMMYPAKLVAYQLSPPDVVGVTRPRYGWTAKTFKVKSTKFTQDTTGGKDSAPGLGVDLELRATGPQVYAFDISEYQTLTGLPSTGFGDPGIVSPVTGLTATSGASTAIIRADGVVISRVHLTWTSPADISVTAGGSIAVEFKKSADPDWISAGSVGGSSRETWVSDVSDGVSYDFRVFAKNAAGASSTAATVTGHVVQGVGYGAASYRPTSNPLTASDVGGFPRVQVAAFVMRIAGKGDVSLSAGSVDASSADFGKTAFIFYDDLPFLGGSVVYQLTFSRETALGTTGGRFFVGSIPLPNSGGANTVGNNDGGTGAQYARSFILSPPLAGVVAEAGAWNNLGNVSDDSAVTFSDTSATAANSVLHVSGFPAYASLFSQIVLRVKHRLASLSGASAQATIEHSVDDGATWLAPARTITAADGAPVVTIIPLPSTQKTERVHVRVTTPGGVLAIPESHGVGTRADDAAVGTVVWSNGVGTSVTGINGATTSASSHYLKLTNFGFAIPNTATILGVRATVNKYGSYETDPDTGAVLRSIADFGVYLIKGGTVQLSSAKTAGYWPSIATDVNYGSSLDMWGQTLAYSDVNASNFGLAIRASLFRDISAANSNAQVNAVTLTVYYGTGGAASSAMEVYQVEMEVTI